MELWLDTIDFDLIERAKNTLRLTGITTNPTILSSSSLSSKETIKKLLTLQNGLVAVQVTANHQEEMVAQAINLSAFSPRIIIKIPVTEDGLSAMHVLSQKNIQTMATAIFEPAQVLLSILAGATYAAPYFSKISQNNEECYKVLQAMQSIVDKQKSTLKIIAAAIHDKQQIIECAKEGVPAITVPAAVYRELVASHPATLHSLKNFQEAWGTRELLI